MYLCDHLNSVDKRIPIIVLDVTIYYVNEIAYAQINPKNRDRPVLDTLMALQSFVKNSKFLTVRVYVRCSFRLSRIKFSRRLDVSVITTRDFNVSRSVIVHQGFRIKNRFEIFELNHAYNIYLYKQINGVHIIVGSRSES